jgi:ribosomal protein S18 acetylase RimI-like enzyme
MVNVDLAGLASTLAFGADADGALTHGRVEPCSPADYAELIGSLRGSPPAQRLAHARRLQHAPVRHVALLLRDAHGELLACGQYAREDRRVGLYDVFVPPARRGQGWGRRLCALMLARAHDEGARLAYLQVEADNTPARAIYHRLGFADGYAYHYRCDDPASV